MAGFCSLERAGGFSMRRTFRRVFFSFCASVLAGAPEALVVREEGRFGPLVRHDPAASTGIAAEAPRDIPGYEAEALAWERFSESHGGSWRAFLDRRSGTPLLVEGPGIEWFDPAAGPPSIERLEARARAFLGEHRGLFKVDPAELVLEPRGSGPVDEDHVLLVFERRIGGVEVEGHRFLFWVNHGRLVSFGATRWAGLSRLPQPALSVEEARGILYAYMGIGPADAPSELEPARTVLVTTPAEPAPSGPYRGRPGEGAILRLAYRFVVRVEGDPGTWVGKVDAVTGDVLAFYDDTRYAQVKGGVHPVSNDGLCPDGCEQAGFPMPYADVSVDGSLATANDLGLFSCGASGSNATTTLKGPFVRVSDNCGIVSEARSCGGDLDLGSSPGTDCQVPPGTSPGNTRASRTSFYHLNRAMEKGRAWLPGNAWLSSQLGDNVNINSTCNAFWDGTVNFYKSGGGCRNTGEQAGVILHEWGHGLDANDGGGFDNPSEAYGDVVAFFETHLSCIGRGFVVSGNCGGYGDPCLDCTGVRDQDFDKHQSHTPATPSGFVQNNCGGGGGPCGKEEHCESHVAAQAVWDLAFRDLPAMGLDPQTSWQIADRLFYKSRQGSGGNAYNCALPSSDGCNAGSWFNSFRNVDDDDGNLANGTPHAAAIFAAFARHGIACGTASDPSNQNFAACTPPSAPVLVASPDDGAIHLSWNQVAGATRYHVLRNDLGCGAGHTIVATVSAPATSYDDTDLPNSFTMFYAVQAEGGTTSCLGPLSNCKAVAALPQKGEIRLDRDTYGCSSTVNVKVVDLGLGKNPNLVETVQVTATSTTEPTPEFLTLTETGPDTSQFTGSIGLASGSAVAGDGILQAAHGDLITVTYQDENTGQGLAGVAFATALADCAGPVASNIRVTDITDETAVVRWTSSEPADSRVEWGPTPALGRVATDAAFVTDHAVTLAPLMECGQFFFRIVSTDLRGNTAAYDAAGSPFSFAATRIPGLFIDNFETNTGWTLEGEWQIGAPQGKGSSPPDPSAAFSGTQVLGHDLTGLGTRPGDYEPQKIESAASPVINATSLVAGQLKFRRWLNTSGGGAQAFVDAFKNGTWSTVWSSDAFFGNSESSWSLQTLDVSAFADGNSQFRVRFRQKGGLTGSSSRSGWNIDRLVLKSANEPDWVACGGCASGPSFAGATGAEDLAPCADTGIRIEWQPAASWGTGSTGTYSVYRDTTPGFAPSAANRIAAGLVATSFTDATAPNGVTLYYLVRAENNETCSTGPNNGGVTDSNTVYVSARDDTSQPAPGDVGPTLRASNVNDAHVRLSWQQTPGAVRYRVYRADGPQGPFSPIAEVGTTVFEDKDELASGLDRAYVVKALDACGNEGP